MMKKLVSLILVIALALSMFGGCANATEKKECTIAVAVGTYDEQKMKVKTYFQDYLAKELDIKFIFSEEGSTVEQILTFVENAYSAGADAVLDLATSSANDVEPVAAKCKELGMYFSTYYGGSEGKLKDNEFAVGVADSDPKLLKNQFDEMVKTVLDNGKEVHSMVLCTVAARYNNEQQQNSSLGALKAFKDMYNLTYTEEDMKKFIMLDAVTEIPTGREDVKITINPMFVGDALSEILKKNEYDTVVVAGNLYLRLESAVSDAEKANKKNIKFMTLTEVAATTANSFNTKDSTGNPSLDGAVLSTSCRAGIMLALAVNGVYGDRDAILMNGQAGKFNIPLWNCYSKEQYELINKLDADAATYVFNADEVKKMIKFYNKDVTSEFLNKYIQETTTYDSVMERKGLK